MASEHRVQGNSRITCLVDGRGIVGNFVYLTTSGKFVCTTHYDSAVKYYGGDEVKAEEKLNNYR